MRDPANGGGPSAATCRGVVAGAGAVLALVLIGAAAGNDGVRGWFYQLVWLPLLAAADGALGLRGRRPPLLSRPRFAASLFLWSAPFWLLFEAANLRLANWYYVFLPRALLLRWMGTLVAFSTVLPALCLGSMWVAHFLSGRETERPAPRPARLPRPVGLRLVRATGALFLALCLWKPAVFFPLIWGAVTLLLEPFNIRRAPERSLLHDILSRRWSRIGYLLGGGLLVGALWELINFGADARWIYTVPGLESGKLFEMPLPGFLGFPVLAVDAYVAYHSLVLAGLAVPGWDSLRRAGTPEGPAAAGGSAVGRRSVRPTGILIVAGLCASVLWGIDRYTTDSLWPRLEDLHALTPDVRARLSSGGLTSLRELERRPPGEIAERAGVDGATARSIKALARLVLLRGIGAEHASALARAGIGSVCALALAAPEEVSAAVRRVDPRPHVGSPARARVWQHAARRQCTGALRRRLALGVPSPDLAAGDGPTSGGRLTPDGGRRR